MDGLRRVEQGHAIVFVARKYGVLVKARVVEAEHMLLHGRGATADAIIFNV